MAGPNLSADEHETIAREFYEAYHNNEPIDPPRARWDLAVADGYEIARRVIDRRLEHGEAGGLAGYKIGFTSAAVREDLAVEEPAFGRLLDRTVPSIAVDPTIDTSEFIAPRIEPEITFVLDERPHDSLADGDVLDAVSAIVPAIEIVDCRIRDWDFTPPEAIADNALAAALLVGEEGSPGGLDGEDRGSDFDPSQEHVAVEIDEQQVAAGTGAAVLGHPMRALTWLADALAERGETFEAGDLVSTGSITRPVPIEAGQRLTARFDSLGSVDVDIE
ncbi:2-oxopent-4-enoate hydratase [Halobacteriales archaeon QS_3_64_16]|nr:MAG: 2-oxopent-4-enoate hydratase [Halobacteriales archaeon QS_3_64_16]